VGLGKMALRENKKNVKKTKKKKNENGPWQKIKKRNCKYKEALAKSHFGRVRACSA
jgi:hypothetical protein